MSNNYNLETDLDFDVEDVEAEGGYEEENEEYENYGMGSEFGNYNPEEANEKWGGMDFDQLVVEMEDIVSRGKRYFFSKTKRVVNGEELAQLSQHIQDKLPTEIIAAKEVLARQVAIIDKAQNDANAITADANAKKAEIESQANNYHATTVKKAQEEANAIIAKAKETARMMVHESSIYKQAKEEEARIRRETEQRTYELIESTKKECEELRTQARNYAIGVTDGARNFINRGLAGYQKVAMSNLDTIQSVNNQFQNEFNAQVQALGLVASTATDAANQHQLEQ